MGFDQSRITLNFITCIYRVHMDGFYNSRMSVNWNRKYSCYIMIFSLFSHYLYIYLELTLDKDCGPCCTLLELVRSPKDWAKARPAPASKWNRTSWRIPRRHRCLGSRGHGFQSRFIGSHSGSLQFTRTEVTRRFGTWIAFFSYMINADSLFK